MSNPLDIPSSLDPNAVAQAVFALQGAPAQAAAAVVHLNVDIPLATIQAQTSGTAFTLATLPTNAKLLDCDLNVTTAISGGSISACKATIQGGSDAAGTILGTASGTSVFTGVSGAINQVASGSAGTNPYVSRSAQAIKMTLTTTGDTLAHATAGHLSVDLYYAVVA